MYSNLSIKEFFIRIVFITCCMLLILQFLKININTNVHNNISQPKISSEQDVMIYEFINETTRFNKKSGNLEYFIYYTKPFQCCGDTVYGRWLNKQNISKIEVSLK